MKRMLAVLLGVAAASVIALAQAPAQSSAPMDPALDKALAPAPRNLKDGATVIKWHPLPDMGYDTVRKGTNRLVCFDRSGDPGKQPFSVQCTSIANLDRVAENRKFEAMTDKAARDAAMEAAEKNGTRVKPEFGSVWLTMQGADREHARIHTTVAVPGATTKTIGLPEDNKQGGIWIMNAGTSTAHLMTPGS